MGAHRLDRWSHIDRHHLEGVRSLDPSSPGWQRSRAYYSCHCLGEGQVRPVFGRRGWCIGQPLSLQFDVLETITLFVSIVIVSQAISDGKSNWLEGLCLMMVYLIIAVTFFFYPGTGGL